MIHITGLTGEAWGQLASRIMIHITGLTGEAWDRLPSRMVHMMTTQTWAQRASTSRGHVR